jgi:GNAT superfamily N-acetyltransferase
MHITHVTERDLDALLPVMRAYCDFYETSPSDDDLLTVCRALIEDPVHEGVQLIARDPGGGAAGFATICWSWSTTEASRIGVMNDLFVADGARGQGLAAALIRACRGEAGRRGAKRLTWQTAPDNRRAQAVYERVGASGGSTTGSPAEAIAGHPPAGLSYLALWRVALVARLEFAFGSSHWFKSGPCELLGAAPRPGQHVRDRVRALGEADDPDPYGRRRGPRPAGRRAAPILGAARSSRAPSRPRARLRGSAAAAACDESRSC